MMRAARKRISLETTNTIIIGNTMDTDILGSILMDIKQFSVYHEFQKRKILMIMRLVQT